MERISSYFIVNLLWGSGSYSTAIGCLCWNWWIYCLFNGIINYLLSYRSTGWKFYYILTNKKEILILLNSIELLKNIKHFPTYQSHNTYRSVKVSIWPNGKLNCEIKKRRQHFCEKQTLEKIERLITYYYTTSVVP